MMEEDEEHEEHEEDEEEEDEDEEEGFVCYQKRARCLGAGDKLDSWRRCTPTTRDAGLLHGKEEEQATAAAEEEEELYLRLETREEGRVFNYASRLASRDGLVFRVSRSRSSRGSGISEMPYPTPW